MWLIALSGPIGCGKTTITEMLLRQHPSFKVINFADTLREVIHHVYDIPVEEQKKGSVKAQTFSQLAGKTLRHTMQFLGTEAFRTINPSTWADSFVRKVQRAKAEGCSGVVVEDCRFRNERGRIRDFNGFVVYIYRQTAHNALMAEYRKHTSAWNSLLRFLRLPHFSMHQSELEIVDLYKNADFMFNNVYDLTTNEGREATERAIAQMCDTLFYGRLTDNLRGELCPKP